jgi:hypothetical protein
MNTAKYSYNKNLYIKLKQIGGFVLDISEWNEIENEGQENCGIYISDMYLQYILKCNDIDDTNQYLDILVNQINSNIHLFPKIINRIATRFVNQVFI